MSLEGLWDHVENVFERGVGIYTGIVGAKSQAEIEKERLKTTVEIERERTKKILYFGIGAFAVAVAVKILKRYMK